MVSICNSSTGEQDIGCSPGFVGHPAQPNPWRFPDQWEILSQTPGPGWRDVSVVRSLAALSEQLGSALSTCVVVNHRNSSFRESNALFQQPCMLDICVVHICKWGKTLKRQAKGKSPVGWFPRNNAELTSSFRGQSASTYTQSPWSTYIQTKLMLIKIHQVVHFQDLAYVKLLPNLAKSSDFSMVCWKSLFGGLSESHPQAPVFEHLDPCEWSYLGRLCDLSRGVSFERSHPGLFPSSLSVFLWLSASCSDHLLPSISAIITHPCALVWNAKQKARSILLCINHIRLWFIILLLCYCSNRKVRYTHPDGRITRLRAGLTPHQALQDREITFLFIPEVGQFSF